MKMRDQLGIRGLIPPVVESIERQAQRCLERIRSKKGGDLEQYEYLANLKWCDSHLFYRLLIDNMTELAPLVYTPTVGDACLQFSRIYAYHSEGLFISLADRGRFKDIMNNYKHDKLDICVVTDGSRILGLGDLGLNGMGIPIGKLSLYVACAGILPERTVPIILDYGTNNQSNLADPFYLGLRQPRISNKEALEFIKEFMEAIQDRWPGIIVQFEDFNTELAFNTLNVWNSKAPCFNDDIQGTGAVVLAGLINAIEESGKPAHEHKFVFFGAGSAGVGVADMIKVYFQEICGFSEDQARDMFWLVDSKGLVTNNRGDVLAVHKRYFSRRETEVPRLHTLEEIVEYIKPTGLFGLSTITGSFTRTVVERMSQYNSRPIIFPLSNPSCKSECNFNDTIEWTRGQCIFASGSPFPETTFNGKTYQPGQGAILSSAKRITNHMVLASAQTLAQSLTQTEKAEGLIYPRIERIRQISALVALGVIKAAVKEGVAQDEGWIQWFVQTKDDSTVDAEALVKIQNLMYDPKGPVPGGDNSHL